VEWGLASGHVLPSLLSTHLIHPMSLRWVRPLEPILRPGPVFLPGDSPTGKSLLLLYFYILYIVFIL
jgi:hypothetical protein